MDHNVAANPISAPAVLDNEYATLRYYPGSKIVHHTFHQPTSGQPFREVVTTGVALLRAHKAAKWLSDDRHNLSLTPEDAEWARVNWFPCALEAGWKYWALVVPADFKARLNLGELVDEFSLQRLSIMVFTTPEEGLIWLSSVGGAG